MPRVGSPFIRLPVLALALALGWSLPASAQLTLDGSFLQLPISGGGRFLTSSGARYNAAGTGGGSGVDFWYPGTPVYNTAVSVGGTTFLNGASWSAGPTVTDLSTGTWNAARITGRLTPTLEFTRIVAFEDDDRVITVHDTFTNHGSAATERVVVLDSTDPDQGAPGTFSTSNDVATGVVTNDMVTATAGGLTLAFASDHPSRWYGASGFNNRAPLALYGVAADPNGASADIAINQLFDYGALGAGETKQVTWHMVFATSVAGATTLYRERVQADVRVTLTDSADPLPYGATFSYTATVTNGAPGAATEVTFVDDLPPGVSLLSTVMSQGTCSVTGKVLRCALGDLRRNASATVTITVRAVSGGVLTNRVSVSAYQTDPVPANNSAVETTLVEGPRAGDDGYTTAEDTALVVRAPGLLANDVDPAGSAFTASIGVPPASGTLEVAVNGGFTYTPAPDFFGVVAFTYRATNGAGQVGIGVVTIAVSAVNDAPVANAQSLTFVEDTPGPIVLTGADVDGDVLTYAVVSTPTRGSLSGTAPNLTYTPNPNANGSDSFRFRVSDPAGASAEAVVAIALSPVNDPPAALPQNVVTVENTPIGIVLEGVDADGDALTFAVVAQPTRGALAGTAPNLTYTPGLNYSGADTFTFRVSDGTSTSPAVTVIINIGRTNRVPVAGNVSLTTPEDTPRTVTLAATDADGDPLTYSVLTNPAHGTLTGAPPNLTYRPDPAWSGVDAFTYLASDRLAFSNIATVTLAVTPVNDAPVALPQALATPEDLGLPLRLAGTDEEGDALTFAIVAAPAHGTLSGTPPNLTYQPAPDYVGTDSFTFVARDASLSSAPAAVLVTITPVNDRPTAVGGTSTTPEDTPLSLVLSGVDPESDALSFRVLVAPTRGTLTGTPPRLVYTPARDSFGPDSLVFVASDGALDSQPATLTFDVTPVNDAPVATAAAVTTAEDTPVELTLAGSDPEGDALAYAILTPPGRGTLSGAAPNLTYTPDRDFFGADVIVFTTRDGSLSSAGATIRLTVTPANDRPVATPVDITTPEDTAVSFALAAVDVDADALTFTVVTGPSHGTLSGTPPNLVYRPDPAHNGPDSFTFSARDASLSSAPATVTINVTPVNDPPVATPGSVTTLEDTLVDFVLAGTDSDGEPLTYDIVTPPAHGTLSDTPPNLRYTPAADYNGTDVLTFRVSDGISASSAVTVRFLITPVNDGPVALPQTLATEEDTPLGLALAAVDPEGDRLTFTIGTRPARGTLTGTPPNVVYRPAANFFGTDSFTFSARDASLGSAEATVTIEVLPANDAPSAVPAAYATDEDTPLALALAGTDPENDPLTFEITEPPQHGALSGTPPNLVYLPARDYAGPDAFRFVARDSELSSTSSTVRLTVTAVNDPPTLVVPTPEAPLDALEGTLVLFRLAAVDPDGPSLRYSVEGAPAAARVDVDGGTFAWTPTWEDAGAWDLTLVATDGSLAAARPLRLAVRFLDLDEDGLPDRWERTRGLDPTTPDSDGDTIDDLTEVGTVAAPLDTDRDGTLDALDRDSDADGLRDAAEAGDAELATPPIDTDRDGLSDFRDPDSDSDGVPDLADLCRITADRDQLDLDLDGVGDACDDDRDGDGVSNAAELTAGLSPDDADSDRDTVDDGEEFGPGPLARDTDSDTTADALDDDADDDGIPDAREAGDAELTTPPLDSDEDGLHDYRDPDSDDDEVPDRTDLCRIVADPAQVDTDGDGQGDACDGDEDGDGVPDELDVCPLVPDPDQLDTDGDGRGDACAPDDDGDGVPDATDLCPVDPDPDQRDSDDDRVGDACDPEPAPPLLVGGCSSVGAPGLLLALAALAARRRRRK